MSHVINEKKSLLVSRVEVKNGFKKKKKKKKIEVKNKWKILVDF